MMKQFVAQDFCLKCRGCCRFLQLESAWSPNLMDKDIRRLLENGIPAFFIQEDQKIRLSWDQKQDSFICSLLEASENKCRAYSFRPLECQLYPFLINRKDNKIYISVDVKCPFVQGKLERPDFKEYVHYLRDFFDNPDIKKSLNKNLRIIQEYAQVIDLFPLKI